VKHEQARGKDFVIYTAQSARVGRYWFIHLALMRN